MVRKSTFYLWFYLTFFVLLAFEINAISYVLQKQTEVASQAAYAKLTNTLKQFEDKTLAELPAGQSDGKDHFADLMISIYMDPVDVHRSDGQGQDEKYFAGLKDIKKRGKGFIVYAAGNANEVNFETSMSKLGAAVYSFDCTVKNNPAWKNLFTFYPWCVGHQSSFEGNTYVEKQHLNEKTLIFKTLSQIRAELGHPHIDIFKFDIEGFEWDMMNDEIVHGDVASLPRQLLFELHTERSNPEYVPAHLVNGKRRQQVDQLLLDLYNLGYRLANWEYNNGDKHCIEVCMININHHKAHTDTDTTGVATTPATSTTESSSGGVVVKSHQVPPDTFLPLGSLSARAVYDPLIMFNGYVFHQEMYGYVIYYCLFYRRPIIIYSVSDKLLFNGWIEFYQSFFKDVYHLITWKDVNDYEADRVHYANRIILVGTDDDPKFKKEWVTNMTLTIDHWYTNRAPQYPYHLAIRAFRAPPYVEDMKLQPNQKFEMQQRPHAIPTYPAVSSVDKLAILASPATEGIQIAIVGGERYSYPIINRLRAMPMDEEGKVIPPITIHVVARANDPIHKDKHLIKNHLKVVIYSDISSTEVCNILSRVHFVMIDVATSKPSHIVGYSMTASIPLSLNFLARLVMSSFSNAIYKFKSAVEFDLFDTADIMLDIRPESLNSAINQVTLNREEQIHYFHDYMNRFPQKL